MLLIVGTSLMFVELILNILHLLALQPHVVSPFSKCQSLFEFLLQWTVYIELNYHKIVLFRLVQWESSLHSYHVCLVDYLSLSSLRWP